MRGRKHNRTPESAALVEKLVISGATQDIVARVLDVSLATLKNRYRDVLDNSMARVNAEVAATALSMALSGRHPVMTMFWLNSKAGFSPKSHVDVNAETKIVWQEPPDTPDGE